MLASQSGGPDSATDEDRSTDRQKDSVPEASNGYPRGGGPHSGLAYILWEIEPSTLPEDDPWAEVARRIFAWREGRDGWRTGEIGARIDDYGGDER